jgi:hypothetical protein
MPVVLPEGWSLVSACSGPLAAKRRTLPSRSPDTVGEELTVCADRSFRGAGPLSSRASVSSRPGGERFGVVCRAPRARSFPRVPVVAQVSAPALAYFGPWAACLVSRETARRRARPLPVVVALMTYRRRTASEVAVSLGTAARASASGWANRLAPRRRGDGGRLDDELREPSPVHRGGAHWLGADPHERCGLQPGVRHRGRTWRCPAAQRRWLWCPPPTRLAEDVSPGSAGCEIASGDRGGRRGRSAAICKSPRGTTAGLLAALQAGRSCAP